LLGFGSKTVCLSRYLILLGAEEVLLYKYNETPNYNHHKKIAEKLPIAAPATTSVFGSDKCSIRINGKMELK
jgi:hypothetical protein